MKVPMSPELRKAVTDATERLQLDSDAAYVRMAIAERLERDGIKI